MFEEKNINICIYGKEEWVKIFKEINFLFQGGGVWKKEKNTKNENK